MSFLGSISNALSSVAGGIFNPLGTIAGGISAVGNLFGSDPSKKAMQLAEMQHQWDVEENQKNRDWQSAEFDRQFDKTNAYNSPEATKERLTKAGLNGSAILGGQGSAIGQSTASPSAPSGAHGLNPIPDVVSQVGFQSQESLMRRLEMLGNLSKNTFLLPETKAKLSAEVQDVLNDAKYKDIKTQSEEFILSLDKILKPYERQAGLQQALAHVALTDANTRLAIKNGDVADADLILKAEEKLLMIAKRHLSEKELDRLKLEIKWYDKLREQDIQTAKSEQARNYASAEESHSQADVNREEKRIRSAIAAIKEQTKFSEIESLISQYRANGFMSDAVVQEALLKIDKLKQVREKRSAGYWREIDGFADWLSSHINFSASTSSSFGIHSVEYK